jgi:hypothetical protein
VAALLAVGFTLIVLALLPGSRRPLVLLVAAGLLCAGLARASTTDTFVVVVAGLLPVLAGLVLREILDTMRLAARARRADRRAAERRLAARQREYERRRRDRIAA